jgi:hypothetical protein
MRAERTPQQLGCIALKGSPLTPMRPVFRTQTALDTHTRDIAIAAAKSAVSSRAERMSKTGFGKITGNGAQNRARLCLKDLKWHESFVEYVSLVKHISGLQFASIEFIVFLLCLCLTISPAE